MRVLIVDDEQYLAEAIRKKLEYEAISADVVHDGAAALYSASVNAYDVILLDRDIPEVHGDEVCRILSGWERRPAILMLTAALGLSEKIDGFALGADDYLSKPFEFPELVARIRALTRRPAASHPPQLAFAGIVLDPFRRTVTRDGQPIALTPKEFAILEILLRAGGGVVSAEQLLEQAWDEHTNPFTNTVKVTVSQLRNKLGAPSIISTVVKAGYAIGTRR